MYLILWASTWNQGFATSFLFQRQSTEAESFSFLFGGLISSKTMLMALWGSDSRSPTASSASLADLQGTLRRGDRHPSLFLRESILASGQLASHDGAKCFFQAALRLPQPATFALHKRSGYQPFH